jgi:preprotein translocase subunit SecE
MAKSMVAAGDERGAQKGMAQVAGFFTRSRDFLKDVRGEMRKVVTPSRKEVQATTTVVIVTTFAFAAYFYVVDAVFGRAIQELLKRLGGTQ